MGMHQREFHELKKFSGEEIYHHILQEDTMKSSTRDKAEGTFHEAKGKVKEVAGKLSDNPKLEAEGTGEKIAGKVQQKVGEVKKVLGK
jgi:uncharacterized protein YjbJ (UPF0337 family)